MTTKQRACEACEDGEQFRCEQMAAGPRHIAPDSWFCCWHQGYSTPRDLCDGCRPSLEDAPEMYA